METINGRIKKADRRSTFKALDMGGATFNRCARYLCLALFSLSIAGCSLSKIKTGLMTGAATTAVVGATTALTGGAIVPTVAGGLTAATASALTAEKTGEATNVTAETVVQEAPDNFFTLLQKLIEMGGWLLLLIFIVPMVLGWGLPGPLERKKKKKN